MKVYMCINLGYGGVILDTCVSASYPIYRITDLVKTNKLVDSPRELAQRWLDCFSTDMIWHLPRTRAV